MEKFVCTILWIGIDMQKFVSCENINVYGGNDQNGTLPIHCIGKGARWNKEYAHIYIPLCTDTTHTHSTHIYIEAIAAHTVDV